MKAPDLVTRAAFAALTSGLVACAGASAAPAGQSPSAAPEAQGRGPAFRDLVMTPAACKTPPRSSMSREDARVDAAAVERIIRRGWAGFETTSAAGADWSAAFAGLALWIAHAPEPITVDALQARLVLALRAAADNHLAFFWYTSAGHARRQAVGRHDKAYTADLVVVDGAVVVRGVAPESSRLVECDGRLPSTLLAPTVITTGDALVPASRPIVLAEAPPPPLHCTFALEGGTRRTLELPMHRVRVGGGAPRATPSPAFELAPGPLPRVTVRTFWSGKDTELTAFVASGSTLRDAKAIVVDVRGNGGGSDTYAKDWLAQLTSQRLVGSVIDRLDSDVTRQGIVNDNTCQIAEGLDDPTALEEARERLAYGNKVVAEAEAAGTPLRMWRSRSALTDGRAPTPFRAPLVTLMDNDCASACESYVSHARQFERSVVVGENSGGVGVFGEVLVYRLPRSGLGMAAGMKHFHDPDPRRAVPEGRGHLPDYWLDGDDALRIAERIAECLAGPACPLR